MSISIKDFLDYQENRETTMKANRASRVRALFDIAMNFDEDNWNGGDPLRDYAMCIIDEMKMPKHKVVKTDYASYYMTEDNGLRRAFFVSTYDLGDGNTLDHILDGFDHYAVYTTKSATTVLHWYKSHGNTENIYATEKPQTMSSSEFFKSIISEYGLTVSDVVLSDYVDVMNDLHLEMDEFE